MVSRKIVIDAAVKATKYISKEVVHGLADHGTKAVVKDFEVKAKKKVSIPSAAISYYHRNYEEVKREFVDILDNPSHTKLIELVKSSKK